MTSQQPYVPTEVDVRRIQAELRSPPRRSLTGPPAVYLATARGHDEHAVRLATEVLDTEERQRARAFRRDSDREAYVMAHAVLRGLLGSHLGMDAAALPLTREPCPGCGGPHGRPALRGAGVHFSLSHSGDLVMVALATAPVGVDVEQVPSAQATQDVQSMLHPDEAAELLALVEQDRPLAVARAWVRKEAYLKGLGTGLSRSPGLDYLGTGPVPAASPPGWLIRDITVPTGYAAALSLATRRPV
ncbi:MULTISPECIES: 4'-phosphopantetheinyl transferase family protein [Kitasatospora]|uniref:4'-phosphopantetheinyl transferase n=2 Tax=Kitasatospora TaxID=2063 RepID=A0ABT1J4D2_9ACTN|nr:4'-phosphopantetheinyl transferase superfamily protein [Kitasatospora paracochleata]MCP2312014.1 4'-phosphopantetheinyl transferase [Kitasatospora paracochleata]